MKTKKEIHVNQTPLVLMVDDVISRLRVQRTRALQAMGMDRKQDALNIQSKMQRINEILNE